MLRHPVTHGGMVCFSPRGDIGVLTFTPGTGKFSISAKAIPSAIISRTDFWSGGALVGGKMCLPPHGYGRGTKDDEVLVVALPKGPSVSAGLSVRCLLRTPCKT